MANFQLVQIYLIIQQSMSKISLLEPTNLKIPEVDDALEEDSFQEQPLAITQLNTSQSHKDQHLPSHLPNTTQDFAQAAAQLNSRISQQIVTNNNSSMKHSKCTDAQQKEISLEQLSMYFQSRSRVYSQQESKADYCGAICQKVTNMIMKGVLNVNKQQRHLSFQKVSTVLGEQKLKQKIQAKKIDIIESLKQIQEQEIRLRAQKRSQSHHLHSKHRSKVTEEDKRRLAQLIEASKAFEQSVKNKNEQLIQQAKLQKIKEEQQLKKEYESTNHTKKQKILQRLKQLDQQFKQREQLLKQFPLPKANTYSYKKNERQWKRSQSLHDLEFKKKLKQLHQRHALNIQEINQHEKKYSLLLETRALSQSKVKLEDHSLPKRQKTLFDRLVEEQLFEKRQKNQEKMLKVMERQFRQKIARYQQKIDQEYKPKTDPSKSIVITIEKDYSSVSLSKQERVQKGLEYLAKAKEMKKQSSSIQLSKAKAIEVKVQQEKTYKNYLKQQVPFNPLKKELTKILADKEEKSDFQSVLRAKFLVEGLQEKAKRAGDNKMYNSMKTKLMLLQNLY